MSEELIIELSDCSLIHWGYDKCYIQLFVITYTTKYFIIPDSKVNWANMGPTWVLSAPDGPHVGPMNLVIRDVCCGLLLIKFTHIIQDYFTGTGALILSSHTQWSNPEWYAYIDCMNP